MPLEVPAGVPPGVAQMLLGRVRSVSPVATEVAAVLAVAARPLTEPELTVCAGTNVDVVAGLRELLDAHLVETADSDRYRLRHALLVDTVRGTLLASRRGSIHAGVAAVLAARGDESPAEVLAHWASAGDPVKEAHWSVAAARHAEGLFAWLPASGFWQRVWALWSRLGDDQRPSVELGDAVVRCVEDARLSGDDAMYLRLAEAALADDRLTDDAWTSARLLTPYGHRLGIYDAEAGLATLRHAVDLFDRAARPSADWANGLHALVDLKIALGVETGDEDDELARAAALAEQAGAVDKSLASPQTGAPSSSTGAKSSRPSMNWSRRVIGQAKRGRLSVSSGRRPFSLTPTNGCCGRMRASWPVFAASRKRLDAGTAARSASLSWWRSPSSACCCVAR